MWQRHRRIFFLMLAPGGNFTFTSACRLHNIAFTRCSADLTPEHRLQHARALSHGWHFDLWKSIRAGRIRSFHTNLHYNRVVDLGTTSWCSQNHKPDDLAEVESIDGTAGGAAESVSELHYCKVGFTTGPLRARTVSLHVVRHGMALDTSSGLNLAFRLLRLTAPTLHASLPSLTHDVRSATGFSPMLQLPSGTDILLGENFACYVRLINLADAALSNVAVKCELQTDRQRVVLHDTAASPLGRLSAGESYDFLLRHDVKEPHDHVLTCSATYVAADGSLHSEQQTTVFVASNPLSVRTKTRSVAGTVFLEVCVENLSPTAPIFLDYVRLEASGGGTVEHLGVPKTLDGPSAAADAPEFLQRHIDGLQIVQPSGAHNLLYRLGAPPPPGGRGGNGKAELGRLEIKWRRSMGEVGRLQTQHIMLSAAQPQVELRLTDVPPAAQLERPFSAALTVKNHLDRRLGPLQISYSGLTSGAPSPPFLVQGLQDATIEELAPHSSVSVPLTLLPMALAVHSFSGLTLLDAGGKPVASLEAAEIFVQIDEVP